MAPRIRSFRARLILGAVIWTALGVTISSIVLSAVFRGAVEQQFDHDAIDHSSELAILIGMAGECPGMVSGGPISDSRFMPRYSGAYWQIQCSNGEALTSRSLGSFNLPFTLGPGNQNTSLFGVVQGPTGPMRFLQRRIDMNLIGVGIDERLVDAALVDFRWTLGLSLVAVALALIIAAIAQVTFGLRPLARVRTAVREIRSGEREAMPDDLPVEVAPLAEDLNLLIKANDEIMRRARARAGNLAHALKNPLAILVDEGSRLRQRGDFAAADVIDDQCRRMQRQIDYEMARGRAAAHGDPRSAAEVGPVVRTIVAAVARIYQARGLDYSVTGDDSAYAACDPQDLSEIVGNLVDNAAKWAQSRVAISIRRREQGVEISVEDDGPGIPPDARQKVFDLGARLDESVPGTGLGLAISRDLVVAHRGRIWIDASPQGGTAVRLELPAGGLDRAA